MARLQGFIDELSTRYRFEKPAIDAEGIYLLTFDDDLEVRCFEKFDLIYFVSALGTLPTEDPGTWLQRLMNYTLMRIKHSDVAVTMDSDRLVFLHTRFDLSGLRIHEFEERLERYVNTFEEYRNFLLAPPRSPTSFNQMIFKP